MKRSDKYPAIIAAEKYLKTNIRAPIAKIADDTGYSTSWMRPCLKSRPDIFMIESTVFNCYIYKLRKPNQ